MSERASGEKPFAPLVHVWFSGKKHEEHDEHEKHNKPEEREHVKKHEEH